VDKETVTTNDVDDVDAISENVDEDTDFKDGEEVMVDDVEVDMIDFNLDTESGSNVDGDVDVMFLDELDEESARKKVLKSLRREGNEGNGSGTHFYV